MQATVRKGFTLIEILIVVIILGILAAIVIPQFTSASDDARRSSLASQLQTLRGQVELYKLQHLDKYPTDTGLVGGTWDWTKLTGKTDETGAIAAAGKFGPYLAGVPTNPLTNSFAMVYNVDPTAATGGFMIDDMGRVYAAGKTAAYFNDTTRVDQATKPNLGASSAVVPAS
jgi:general secretion pathway protein G